MENFIDFVGWNVLLSLDHFSGGEPQGSLGGKMAEISAVKEQVFSLQTKNQIDFHWSIA